MNSNTTPSIRECLSVLLILWLSFAHATNITGRVIDSTSHSPIAFANVFIVEIGAGAITAEDGSFHFGSLMEGHYTLQVSFIGYQSWEQPLELEGNRPYAELIIPLQKSTTMLAEVSVTPSASSAPLAISVPSLSAKWVNSLPSAQDVMQAMQVLPGISTPQGLTNELNIRGGASIENRFLLDGVEVPIINHFNSGGSSGGVRSLIQSHLIKRTTLHTRDLPLQVGNVTSSVLSFDVIKGNQPTAQRSIIATSSDLSFSWAGRLQDNSQHSMVIAARQSYLTPTLRLLKRPVLSQYSDFYIKATFGLNTHHQLSFLGLGSYDKNRVNKESDSSLTNQFIKDTSPKRQHWYGIAAITYKYLKGSHITTAIVSSYSIRQSSDKVNTEPFILYSRRRYEANHHRLSANIEHQRYWSSGKLTLGGNLYQLQSDALLEVKGIPPEFSFLPIRSQGIAFRWGSYLELNQSLTPKWQIKLGMRYDRRCDTPMNQGQFSPRLGSVYQLTRSFRLHANLALYQQLPPILVLMLRDSLGRKVNGAHVKPFTVRHAVFGFTLTGSYPESTFLTMELFHKRYRNYPVSLRDGVALINKGDGFTVIESEPLTSKGDGRAYGIEVMFRLPPKRKLYGLMSYSLSRSEFRASAKESYRPSAVDTRHVLNLVYGKNFGDGWKIGMGWRIQSGRPFTPWDDEESASVEVWTQSLGRGVHDYGQLNTQRLPERYEVDIRLDKTFAMAHGSLKATLEILNLSLTGKQPAQPVLILDRNAQGEVRFDPDDPERYLIKEIASELFLFLPSIGLSAEF